MSRLTDSVMPPSRYPNVDFYAELTRKGGRDAGTILLVSRDIKNGLCRAAIGVTRGKVAGKDELPVVTWASPKYLADKCRPITEEEARRIDPAMFRCIEAFDRSPEYRSMYEMEVRKPGRTHLQMATI